MNRWIAFAVIVMAAFYQASAGSGESPAAGALCSESWYRFIDQKVQTGDGQGHGPDIGSEEWKSVIEFKLGLRGQPDLPDPIPIPAKHLSHFTLIFG